MMTISAVRPGQTWATVSGTADRRGLAAAGGDGLPAAGSRAGGLQLLVLQLVLGLAMGGLTPAISALLANSTRPHGWEGRLFYGLDSSIIVRGPRRGAHGRFSHRDGDQVRAAFPLSAVLFSC